MEFCYRRGLPASALQHGPVALSVPWTLLPQLNGAKDIGWARLACEEAELMVTRNTRVEPALTRKQWENALAGPALWEPSTAHMDMALGNAMLPDGDRRKLTRLHAINLRAAATFLETGIMPGPETRAQLVRALAATAGAIEAILPPPPRS